MKTLIKNMLAATSIMITLTACSQDNDKDQVRINANQLMKSQELANAGEQLMMPHTLNLADRVFEMALEKDPTNLKAQFYKSFLKRFMVFEGVLTRLTPYVNKYGNREQFSKMIKDMPNHPAKEFLLGSSDTKPLTLIFDANDIQVLLIEYRKAVQEFRSFINQHADMELDLYLNPMLFKEQIDRNLKDSCTLSSESSKDNISVVCDRADIATVKVNMADLMALKQYAAGEILYLTLYTSYSVGSIDDFLKESKDKDLKPKEIFEKIESIQDAGLLLKDQSMTMVRELGSDFGIALKWALKYQDNLCKKDSEGRIIPRKGFMMKNICITDTHNAQNTLAVLEKVLAGNMKVNLEIEDTKIEKNMNFITLFDRPLPDLRRVIPASWNREGTLATSLKDKTAGGLFPDADINDVLKNNESK